MTTPTPDPDEIRPIVVEAEPGDARAARTGPSARASLLNGARALPALSGLVARGGLARTLFIFLLPLVLGPLVTFAWLIYRQVQADLSAQVADQLTSLAVIKSEQVDDWANNRVQDMDDLAHSPGLLGAVRAYRADPTLTALIQSRLNEFLVGNPVYEAVMLADPATGLVQASTLQMRYDRFVGQGFLTPEQLDRALVSGFMLPPAYEARITDVMVLVVTPIRDEQGRAPVGLLYGFVRDEQLLDLVAPSPGLGSTGRAFLVTRDGYTLAAHTTAEGSTLDSEGIRQARLLHKSGNSRYADPNGALVLGAYRWLPTYQLSLLVEVGEEEATAPLRRFAGVVSFTALGAVVVSLLGIVVITRRLLTNPLLALTEGAQRLAGGDLTGTVALRRRDEIGLLAEAFNTMAADLRDLYQDLERKVEARTQQLQAAAAVGRAATSILSPDELLARVVELIRDRFGFYHVTIFLLDEAGQQAVLHEATGEAGAQLKAHGYRVPVGSQSLVGWVAANRRARIALDVAGDELYQRNPLLPDTRSEAALPLRVGERLLGVLDVQSGTLNAFSQADIDVLQTLADQIAVALENGRLFARQQRAVQLEQRVAELTARLHSSLTVDAILEHAASDLGQAFGTPRVVVRLQPEAEARLAGGEQQPGGPAPAPRAAPGGNGHSGHGRP